MAHRAKSLHMPALLILSRHADAYERLIEAARLPNLTIVTATKAAELPAGARACDVVLGEPSLIANAIADLTNVTWVQSTWAGVEPLLNPALRRDYALTNARGVFGGLMSEYVFGYMLVRERLVLEKYASQQAGRWDTPPPGTLRGKQVGLIGVGSI